MSSPGQKVTRGATDSRGILKTNPLQLLLQFDLVNINQLVNAFANESFQTSSINGVWKNQIESLKKPSQGLALIEQSLTDIRAIDHSDNLIKRILVRKKSSVILTVKFDKDEGTFADLEQGTVVFPPTFDQQQYSKLVKLLSALF